MNSYFDEADGEIVRDKERKPRKRSVDKMECDECGKQASELCFVKTAEGLKRVCRKCKKGIK